MTSSTQSPAPADIFAMDADLYTKNNDSVIEAARYFLDICKNLLEWKKNENILDIGAGDGKTTSRVIVPNLPADFAKLVGIDISEDMVKLAQRNCQNSRIDFLVMDITSEVPKDFQDTFHHVFSFMCLHWVADQRLAFRNILNMLKPGGQMLITMMVKIPTVDVYLAMAESQKYSQYMQHLDKTLFPYRFCSNPAMVLQKLLEEVGFDVKTCKVEQRTGKFESVEAFQNLGLASGLFLGRIPAKIFDSFKEDYIAELMGSEGIAVIENEDGSDSVIVSYMAIYVVANKPV